VGKKLRIRRGLAQAAHEAFFSVNLVYAPACAVLMFSRGYLGGNWLSFLFLRPGSILLYDCSQKVSGLLHLDARSQVGVEISLFASTLVAAVVVFFVLHLVAATIPIRNPLCFMGGATAIALLPLLYIHVLLQMTYTRQCPLCPPPVPFAVTELTLVCAFFLIASHQGFRRYACELAPIAFVPMLYLHVRQWWQYPFWGSPEFCFSALELVLVCTLTFAASRPRCNPNMEVMALALHYTLWTTQLFSIFVAIPLLYPKLLYFVFPCSGFAWLYYVRSIPWREPATR
jgi:hypothetical protein